MSDGTLMDQVRAAAEASVKAWDRFNDPKIRVGPVERCMEDLRRALAALSSGTQEDQP